MMHLKDFQKYNKPSPRLVEGNKKIRTAVSEMETKNQNTKITKTKRLSFEKINKIDKTLN
jgi:hypothetical protein